MIVVIMGVSGSGKSTIAKTLAKKLCFDYVDADDYHSSQNVEKMRRGTALSDEDRLPWLHSLRDAIKTWIAEDISVVLACSALKRNYREILDVDPENVRFAYLKGPFKLFSARLAQREGHFMKETMLTSQFAALEEPSEAEATICDARGSVMEIVATIIKGITSSSG